MRTLGKTSLGASVFTNTPGNWQKCVLGRVLLTGSRAGSFQLVVVHYLPQNDLRSCVEMHVSRPHTRPTCTTSIIHFPMWLLCTLKIEFAVWIASGVNTRNGYLWLRYLCLIFDVGKQNSFPWKLQWPLSVHSFFSSQIQGLMDMLPSVAFEACLASLFEALWLIWTRGEQI